MGAANEGEGQTTPEPQGAVAAVAKSPEEAIEVAEAEAEELLRDEQEEEAAVSTYQPPEELTPPPVPTTPVLALIVSRRRLRVSAVGSWPCGAAP